MTFGDFVFLAILFVCASSIPLAGFKWVASLWGQRAKPSESPVVQKCGAVVPIATTQMETRKRGELDKRIREVLKEVAGCSKVSWDLWEMDAHADPKSSIYDWNYNPNNVGVVDGNMRVKYCGTRDEFVSEMMGLSLSYDIVDMKAVKSLDGSRGVIMLLVCLSGDGTTNIEPDAIEALSSPHSPEAVGDYGIII